MCVRGLLVGGELPTQNAGHHGGQQLMKLQKKNCEINLNKLISKKNFEFYS
jgi:hypothetical protein